GTKGAGLCRVRPQALTIDDLQAALPGGAVKSMCEESNGVQWVVMENGAIGRRDESGWNQVGTPPTGPRRRPSSIVSDGCGGLWIGGRSQLDHFQEGRFDRSVSADDGLDCRNIHALLLSQIGELWIAGTDPKIQWFKDGRFHGFDLPPGLGTVRAMAEDVGGNIWIGTSRGGLFCATDQGITNTTPLLGLAPTNISIKCLLATPDGSLWIGFADQGLGRLQHGKFARIDQRLGLRDDSISQVLADDQGWIWCGSDHGIFKLREADFDALAAGQTDKIQCVTYGRGEGIPTTSAISDGWPMAL